MIEELQAASSRLNAALERYLTACSTIATCYDPRNTVEGVSRAIPDLIPSELELIALYETRIKQAKAIINQTRNVVPNITPINTLPPDILSYIFQLVFDMQACYFRDQYNLKPFSLVYPETLSRVCSCWRQIAKNTRVLWSHIDVVPFQGYISSSRLLTRAEVFAARADPTPLDIHIIGETSSESPDIDIHLNTFCTSIATRIRSLNLSTCHIFSDLHHSALEACLSNCVPGTLKELIIAGDSTNGRNPFGFIESSEATVHPNRRLLDIPHRRLEECLLPVTVLRLTGIYFRWTSQAYRGLVELRLVPHHYMPVTKPTITESQLIAIFASSPGLRVLHFGLEIIDLVPYNPSRVAASLDDLEVINIRPMNTQQYDVLLRLLEPGSKPLQLSTHLPLAGFTSLFSDEFRNFFGRSNVTELYIQSTGDHPLKLLEVLDSLHMPHLRTLSLAGFYLGPNSSNHARPRGYEPRPPAGKDELEFRPTLSQLDALHLTYCCINIGHLLSVTKIVPIRALKLADCRAEEAQLEKWELEHLCAKIASTVNLVPAPWPLEQWDPWN